MSHKYLEIYPNFQLAHELLKKIKSYKLNSDELCKQGKLFQGLLYTGISGGPWSPEKLINSFRDEYLKLNDNKINIDWYFQCFFLWQRLKGEFDRREKRGGAIRSNKVKLFQEMIYEIFQDGVTKYKIKFVRSDIYPKIKIPVNAILCHDFYWWIK